jgi:hypothetical protein
MRMNSVGLWKRKEVTMGEEERSTEVGRLVQVRSRNEISNHVIHKYDHVSKLKQTFVLSSSSLI